MPIGARHICLFPRLRVRNRCIQYSVYSILYTKISPGYARALFLLSKTKGLKEIINHHIGILFLGLGLRFIVLYT